MVIPKILLKILNSAFPFADFLYILQLEEYYTLNYLKSALRLFWRRNLQQRGVLKYTTRIQATLIISIGIYIFTIGLLINYFSNLMLSIIISTLLIPIWVGVANFILNPFIKIARLLVQKKAAKIFSQNSGTKVIAVAGSYGKTTTKNLIFQLIRHNYKTQMVPGNINTPTGIAAWVIKNFDPTADYLIVEMDTYELGEIKQSCTILPPDIAIITNVGDQHLARFGSQKKLEKALKEIFEYSKPNAIHIFGPNLKIHSKKPSHFSESVQESLKVALKVAEILKIPPDFVADSITKIELPERRQKKIDFYGFETLDDSYNISLTTAQAGLRRAQQLAQKSKKKLLVITAGIPELGSENKNANIDLGCSLSQKADCVVLLSSILAKQIKQGISQETNLINAQNMKQVWEIIQAKFRPSEVLVLMQPELTDLYY